MVYEQMPQFVSERTEATRDDPTEGATVDLVARVEADALATAEQWVRDHDGEILDSLDHGMVELELPEVHVAALCDLPYLRSVERADETIGVLDPGN